MRAHHPSAYSAALFTSARTGEGILDLRAHFAQLLTERGLQTRPLVASGA